MQIKLKLWSTKISVWHWGFTHPRTRGSFPVGVELHQDTAPHTQHPAQCLPQSGLPVEYSSLRGNSELQWVHIWPSLFHFCVTHSTTLPGLAVTQTSETSLLCRIQNAQSHCHLWSFLLILIVHLKPNICSLFCLQI